MCGIAGFWESRDQHSAQDILNKMIVELNHRGPDYSNTSYDKNLKLLVGKFVDFTNESLENPEVGASIRWFLKSHKKVRVFSCIMDKFVANEPIYKESIIKDLREFSYKTVTTIIDESITRKYLTNTFNGGKKIKLLKPSEELIIDLLNWNILRFSKIDTNEIFK